MLTALAILVIVIGLLLGIAALWVRSERGWLPRAGAWDALSELAFRLYPRRVVPRDRQRARLWRVVRSQVSFDVRGATFVPSTVRVAMNPDDLAALDALSRWVAEDLADRLVKVATDKGWKILARPVVILEPDPDRPVGRPRATAEYASGTIVADSDRDGGNTTEEFDNLVEMEGIGDAPSYVLDGHEEIRIGRDRSCELRIGDERVSRLHAWVRRKGEGWEISDLGSTNGIKVNGSRVDAAVLADGDQIELSRNTAFLFRLRTRRMPSTGAPATRPGEAPTANP